MSGYLLSISFKNILLINILLKILEKQMINLLNLQSNLTWQHWDILKWFQSIFNNLLLYVIFIFNILLINLYILLIIYSNLIFFITLLLKTFYIKI